MTGFDDNVSESENSITRHLDTGKYCLVEALAIHEQMWHQDKIRIMFESAFTNYITSFEYDDTKSITLTFQSSKFIKLKTDPHFIGYSFYEFLKIKFPELRFTKFSFRGIRDEIIVIKIRRLFLEDVKQFLETNAREATIEMFSKDIFGFNLGTKRYDDIYARVITKYGVSFKITRIHIDLEVDIIYNLFEDYDIAVPERNVTDIATMLLEMYF